MWIIEHTRPALMGTSQYMRVWEEYYQELSELLQDSNISSNTIPWELKTMMVRTVSSLHGNMEQLVLNIGRILINRPFDTVMITTRSSVRLNRYVPVDIRIYLGDNLIYGEDEFGHDLVSGSMVAKLASDLQYLTVPIMIKKIPPEDGDPLHILGHMSVSLLISGMLLEVSKWGIHDSSESDEVPPAKNTPKKKIKKKVEPHANKWVSGRCIDCGSYTCNYRCSKCKTKFYRKNGYRIRIESTDGIGTTPIISGSMWRDLSPCDTYKIPSEQYNHYRE